MTKKSQFHADERLNESSRDSREYHEQRFASLPRIHFKMLSNPMELVHFHESIEKREPYTVRHFDLAKYSMDMKPERRGHTSRYTSRKMTNLSSDITSREGTLRTGPSSLSRTPSKKAEVD